MLDKLKSIFKKSTFDNVRIEKILRFQIEYEIKTGTVYFNNDNIEDCIRATRKFGIEHIHLQTNRIEFLSDPRLTGVKGVTIQFEVEDISPLYNLTELTHLHLPENISTEFDFSRFKNLIYLGGPFPSNYTKFDQLSELKYVRLFKYRKSNLIEFSALKSLKKIELYFASIENLNGLSHLTNLSQLYLEGCKKLITLNGIGSGNASLQKLHITDCKILKDAHTLSALPNLRELSFYNVYKLDSLSFLDDLSKLENLMLHPSKVGVQYEDYYPLIEILKRLNKLENLKGWKPLNDYAQNKKIIDRKELPDKPALELIRDNLGIMSWVEKQEDGLEQYSRKNCKKAEAIILDLLKKLEAAEHSNQTKKEELIKNCILDLNRFNDDLDGSFIETGEREELCDLFDNIAEAVGLDATGYQDGIASQWRDW